MQFKNPEILWALLLLIIPVIIHLFQLRKFQKVSFTNVKFLKEVVIQTRKSQKLKKWVLLMSRMLLFSMLILAFAQPYLANRNILKTNTETVIYLDNSFSLQAMGDKGPLFESAVQQLITSINDNEVFSLFTNTDTYKNTTLKSIKDELLNFKYSANQLSSKEILLRSKNLFSKDTATIKNLIVISDFQSTVNNSAELKDAALTIRPVILKPSNLRNISIDSVFIKKNAASGMEVNIILTRNKNSANDTEEEKSVSLYNNDILTAKAATSFADKNTCNVTFTLPAKETIEAEVSVEDSGLFYDNTFYFTVSNSDKINVLNINDADFEFLNRIFTKDEFNLTNTALKNLNFSKIENQQLIILNELKTFTPSLLNALTAFEENGGFIVFIPSAEASLEENNRFLRNFRLPVFSATFEISKKITEINFDHPVFKDVFEQRVTNFQYPQSVKGFIAGNLKNGVLNYQDGAPFLWNKGSIYVFNSALQAKYANFKNSPLIVPVFYNLALQSMPLPKLYYYLGVDNKVAINTNISNDKILELVEGKNRYIPLQQSTGAKTLLTLNSVPKNPGNYDVVYKDEILKKLSFNHTRKESVLEYTPPENLPAQETTDNVALLFENLKKENSVTALWKWFVIFALGFLIFEILILKYLK
jgi:hypothetical protein